MADKQHFDRSVCINCGNHMTEEHVKKDMFGLCENCSIEMLFHQLYG
ncbi:MAG: hypothetical protein ACOXZ5_04635 [Syntrophomonadaceae bacterium]|jgi:DNA-directed RNA polymerase subunit RPC12/RpoP